MLSGHPFIVKYKPGEWVKGKFPLFFFKDLKIARQALKDPEVIGCEIWSCLVKDSQEIELVADEFKWIPARWKYNTHLNEGAWPNWRDQMPKLLGRVKFKSFVTDSIKLLKPIRR